MADRKSFDGGKTHWKTQSYKASEWDPVKDCPLPKLGGAKRDLKAESDAFREGWDRIFGNNKGDTHGNG